MGGLVVLVALGANLSARAQDGEALPSGTASTNEAPPPAHTSSESEWPTKLGPLEIRGDVGHLRFGLATQFRVGLESREGAMGRADEVSVSVRRLRTTLRGGFFDDRLTYAFQLNVVPGAFELIDAWLDGEIVEGLHLRVGQMKVPFTRYRLQSFTRLLLADWAESTRYLGGERQLGLLVSGDPAHASLYYSVGVFTGQNRRAGHGVGQPILYGEPVLNPSDAGDGFGGVNSVHPEVVGLLSHGSEGMDTNHLTDETRGPLRYLLTFSAAVDLDPIVALDHLARFAPEAWLKIGGLTLVGVGYLGLSLASVDQRVLVSTYGFDLEAAYRFDRTFEIAARDAWTRVGGDLSADARSRADGLIAMAADPMEMATLTAQYQNVGLLVASNELTFGLNVYLIGDSLKWQTDGTWYHRTRRDGDREDFRARTQIQLAF